MLVVFKYFVQSDWRIVVQTLELPYNVKLKRGLGWGMVFNATFKNSSVISLRSVVLMEETGVSG